MESKSLREGRRFETSEPDPRETPEWRIRNDAINDSHLAALESRRKTAATSLIIALDRLFDVYWMKLGLPEWSVRGGPLVGGDITVIELIHLCGNYLRHVHEWLAGGPLSVKAQMNIERLQAAGSIFGTTTCSDGWSASRKGYSAAAYAEQDYRAARATSHSLAPQRLGRDEQGLRTFPVGVPWSQSLKAR